MATKSLKNIVQHEAYRLVFMQLGGVLLLTVMVSFASNAINGAAVLAGGFAYGLPNLVFVWRVFRYAGAKQMHLFVAAFFVGEMAKLIISAILFLLIVKYLAVSLLSALIGFIGAIVSFWFVCMWHFAQKNTPELIKS